MSRIKELKLAERAAAQQRQLISELKLLIGDIDRCEHSITSLKRELETANSKYPIQRTTREDVAYLTDLLDCAKKKLAWEKQLASLQRRVPALLDKMNRSFNDPCHPPSEQTRDEMLRTLQAVQASMERLQAARVD